MLTKSKLDSLIFVQLFSRGNQILEQISLLQNLRRWAFLNNWFVSLFASAVLIFGWGFGNDFLIRLFPNYPAMVPATALTIIFSGMGSLASIKRPTSLLPIVYSLLIFATVGLEYLTPFARLTHPLTEEMSWASTFAALLFATSLLAHNIRISQLRFSGTVIDTAGVCLTSIPLIGYILDAEALWGTFFYTTIALHSALSFFLLFAASLVFQAKRNWVQVLFTDEPGSLLSRRLLPFVILGPIVFCGVTLYATRREILTADFRLTILAFVMMASGSLAVVIAARQLNRLERNARRFERQLRQRDLAVARSDKIAVLGQLVGGVAHDFNNILSIIIGNLELLEEDEDEAKRKEYRNQAISAAYNAAGLTRQLLAYGRKSRLDPKPVYIDEATCEALAMFQRLSGSNLEMRNSLDATDYRCNLDFANFQQCILNILINARDAMPDGGIITVTTEIRSVERTDDLKKPTDEPLAQGQYTVVRINDTGSGIDADLLKSVVDPYFTTKGVGEGSGLGLSMAQGFCRQSGGDLQITSAPGHGTTVELFFPVFDTAKKSDVVLDQHTLSVGVSSSRVMIVDDEEGVTKVMVEQLKREGYDVVVAQNSKEALQLLQAGPLPRLVITDVIMPGDMKGNQLAVLIRKLFPEVAVLLMSGYQSDKLREQYTFDGEIEFLQKPISHATLKKAVSDAIKTKL